LATPLAVVLACVAIALAGVPLYVFPESDQVKHVDAVVVLGPISQERIWTAEWLLEHGRADSFVISRPPDKSPVISGGVDYCQGLALCFVARPSTTRGEIEAVNDIARAEGWSEVALITETSHVSRARVISAACATVKVSVVAAKESKTPFEWAWAYVYQTAGFIKAGFVGCLDT